MQILTKRNLTKKSTDKSAENTEKKLSQRETKKIIKHRRIAQNSIKYNMMLEDGICVLDNDLYSRSIRFTDINYQIAPDDIQAKMIENYGKLLQSLGNDIDVSLCINNRLINKEEFRRDITMKWKGDGLDQLRSEMNDHLLNNMEKGNNSIISDKMFTFTCREKNIRDARRNLDNLANEFKTKLESLGCICEIMDGQQRLEILHSITHPGKNFNFDYGDLTPKQTTKDYISPYSFEFKKDYFEMDDRFCCAMVLQNYPTWLKDEIVYELSKVETNLLMTFHMKIYSKDEAIDKINQTNEKIDMQIDSENQKNIDRANFSGSLPHNLRAQKESAEQWRAFIEEDDQRMFQCQFVVLVNESSKEDMEESIKVIERIGKQMSGDFIKMSLEQEMGFNAALPLGIPKEGLGRNLLTSNCARIMPFTSLELLQKNNPIFYGINKTSNNMILCHRKNLANRNGFILGKSGMGKSFKVKQEFSWLFLNDDNADIIIIDPKGEYSEIATTFNQYSTTPMCQYLEIKSSTNYHFNPLDGDISQEGFIERKVEIMIVLMSEMVGNGLGLTGEQMSITDRIVRELFKEYEYNLENEPVKAIMPTLISFYEKLETEEGPVAKQMYRSLWTYVHGSYAMFAQESNVNVDNRMVVYDIHELAESVKTIGLKVILENVREQIIKNKIRGRDTWIYIDEIYRLLSDPYSENFLSELWRWVRSYSASLTGISQDVIDMLRSEKTCEMLTNSEFYIILGQDPIDLRQLQSLLNLSDEQYRYVYGATPGNGLIRFGTTIIPFEDSFPKDTICYKMWNTDPHKSQTEKSERYKYLQKRADEIQHEIAKKEESSVLEKYKSIPVKNKNKSTEGIKPATVVDDNSIISENTTHALVQIKKDDVDENSVIQEIKESSVVLSISDEQKNQIEDEQIFIADSSKLKDDTDFPLFEFLDYKPVENEQSVEFDPDDY